MRPQPKDVLTPVAARVLFGKSGEAVRRATSEGFVTTSFVLQFSVKQVIRLIDLESAKAYWLRGERASYMESFSAEVERMRLKGITVCKSDALTHYRILHPYPLMLFGSNAEIASKDRKI